MSDAREGEDNSGVPSPPAVSAGAMPPAGRFRHFVLTFGTNLAIMGLTFLTGTLNARLLGPTGRGELAAIQNVPAYLSAIALLGMPSAVGYFCARRPQEARGLVLTATMVCLAAALPMIAIGYLVMPWALSSQSADVVHNARIYLSLIVLQPAGLMAFSALQGLKQFDLWNVLRAAPNLCTLIVIVAAWAMDSPRSETVSRGLLIGTAAILPLVYGVLWKRSAGRTPPNPQRAREMFRYGLPTALMLPAGLLNLQLDQMMLGAWLPSRMLGLYAVGVSWSGLLAPVFKAMGSVIFPTLAAAQDPEAKRAMVGRALRLAILVVSVSAIGLAAVTPVLLPLLFGGSFRAAIPAALVLVGASALLNLNGLSTEILLGLGAPRWTLYSQLLALPVTVVTLIVLLPRWSIVGAGVSSLLAYLVVAIVSAMGIFRTCQLSASDLFPRKADVLELATFARRLALFRRGRAGHGA